MLVIDMHILVWYNSNNKKNCFIAGEVYMAYKWLLADWASLFPALEQAKTEEEVKRICEEEIASWRARPGLKKESSLRGPMTETRNVAKNRLSGVKLRWTLAHLAFSEDWYRLHNAPSKAKLVDRLEHQQLLRDPDAIVRAATDLLKSESWAEEVIGLAVCTGRRPGELLQTAVFEPKTKYSVLFSGQLKRRGSPMPAYEIPTLCLAEEAIAALGRIRTMLPVGGQDVRDLTQRHSSLLQFTATKHFAGLVPVREGKSDLYGHLFRSVYARIAVFWYCPTTIADMHYMATIQGHTDFFELESEEARQSYASQAHYADYKIADYSGNIDGRQGVKLGAVGVELLEVFKPKPKKEKVTMTTETQDQQEQKQEGRNRPISVDAATFSREQALKVAKGHRTHTETITLLLDAYEQKGDAQVSQAQLTLTDVIRSVLAQDGSYKKFVEAEGNATAVALLDEALNGRESFNTFLVDALVKEAKFRAGMSTRHAGKDFATMATSQLTRVKHPGATQERIKRAIAAIVAYNDNAQSPNDRWYINATVVQQLSGARFPIIQAYFAEHQADIDAENAEYELNARYNHKPIEGGIKAVITVPEQPSQPATVDASE
jgi:hypothetical protein